MIAHSTGTVAGVAVSPKYQSAIAKMQSFKQRQAPFLLLADSMHTALSQARYISPALRKLAKSAWPGGVTLVFGAKKALSKACYQRGRIAVRVDDDSETRRLARFCGGLLLSSSFNRKGQESLALTHQNRMRFSRHLDAGLYAHSIETTGCASAIYDVSRSKISQLR